MEIGDAGEILTFIKFHAPHSLQPKDKYPNFTSVPPVPPKLEIRIQQVEL